MLEEAGCNVVSLGIFSWSTLEPEEGVFNFEWLENIINKLYERGISVILATPSASRPKWLADKYPEVLRVDGERKRALYGFRHNHCYTSPVYREKTAIINRKLAERFGNHPAVIMWHISNEFGGECHCPLCQEAFRNWLKEKYGTIENLNKKWCTTFWSHTYNSFEQIESPSPIGETQLHALNLDWKRKYGTIENLNKKWCTTFWSHTYNSFEQIESPSPIGETQLHALNLDWKRFVTHQTADFIHHEIQSVREGGSELPTTANLMYYFDGLNYFELAKEIDVVSWDTYPTWHKQDVIVREGGSELPTTANLMYYFDGLNYFELAKEIDVVSWDTYPTWHKQDVIETAYENGMCHDLMRSLKKKPFFQMESCPTSTNWQSVSKLKKPGVLFAQSMQAIAHGGE